MGSWKKLFSVFAYFNNSFFSCPNEYILKQVFVNFKKAVNTFDFYRFFVKFLKSLSYRTTLNKE